ncbi:hypothetical protein KKA95_00885, partial [Patescibacteria group bacterium]|nr:hypothetical protein [Patescibacteria group bacterium]
SLKTNFSCTVNRIIFPEGAVTSPRLQGIYQNKLDLLNYRNQFTKKYGDKHYLPNFQWQKSYHDHYIRNENDWQCHMEYIACNPIKHELPDDWEYVFTNEKYGDLVDGW